MKIRLQISFDKTKEKPPGDLAIYDTIKRLPGIRITNQWRTVPTDREPPVRREKDTRNIHYTFEIENTQNQ